MFDFAHSLSVFLLAQADVERDMFQWGRIHQNTDWILPLLVVGVMFLYIYRIYKKDAVETARPLRWLLRALRCIAVLALLVMYLQPQWRHEKESTIPSRAVIFVDSSLSMAIADQPAEKSGAENAAAREKPSFLRGQEKSKNKIPCGKPQEIFVLSKTFFDFGSFADALSDVIELCTADFAATCDDDFFNVGGMKRESLFDAYAVCDVSDCECLGDAAVLLGDNETFEKLNSLSCTLFDFVVNNDRITYFEFRDVGFELLADKRLKLIHFRFLLLNYGAFMRACSGPPCFFYHKQKNFIITE